MGKRLLFCIAIAGCSIAGPSVAAQAVGAARTHEARQATQQKVRIPTTGYDVAFDTRDPVRRGTPPPEALLKAIVTWLSNRFELPTGDPGNQQSESVRLEWRCARHGLLRHQELLHILNIFL